MLHGPLTWHASDTTAEIKFLLTPVLAAEVLDWSRRNLAPDPYGAGPNGDEYRTTSLYFDTDALDVYHRRGSFSRCKYRVRRYGTSETVFLERKLRTASLLVKRRTTVTLGALDRLSGADGEPAWPGRWFQRRLEARGLRPVCQVSYHRVARMGMGTFGPIRLTVDRDVRARGVDRVAFSPEAGTRVLDDLVPVEMKYRREMPDPFRTLIESIGLEAMTISKYRLSMHALGGHERSAGRA
jgi:hypothetical protein